MILCFGLVSTDTSDMAKRNIPAAQTAVSRSNTGAFAWVAPQTIWSDRSAGCEAVGFAKIIRLESGFERIRWKGGMACTR